MNSPLVSIVTINFNNKSGLAKTFQSVFNQSNISDVEYIVIDGGSNDGSVDLIKESSDKIAYWCSEKDNGIYDAMNKGLAKSTGKYIWFMNSGDSIHSNITIENLSPLMNQNFDIIYGETMMVDPQGVNIGSRSDISTRKISEKLSFNSFKFGMTVGHQSILAKREISPSYNSSYKHVADIDWVLNILKNNSNTCNSNLILSDFMLEGHSTQNKKSAQKERFQLLAKHYGYVPNLWNHFIIVLRKLFNINKL